MAEERPDPYQSEFMAGGHVLHRSKVVSRSLAVVLGLLGTVMLVSGVVAAVSGPAFVPWIMFPAALFTLFCALGLSVLRTVVTADEVHVQYGIWGPRVAVRDIRSCRVVDYDWKKFGGYGIKRSVDGTWAYTLTSAGRVVELVYENGGKETTVVFSAEDPTVTATKIQQAMAGAQRVRVADLGADDAEVEQEREEAEEQLRESARAER